MAWLHLKQIEILRCIVVLLKANLSEYFNSIFNQVDWYINIQRWPYLETKSNVWCVKKCFSQVLFTSLTVDYA